MVKLKDLFFFSFKLGVKGIGSIGGLELIGVDLATDREGVDLGVVSMPTLQGSKGEKVPSSATSFALCLPP